ncbi:hypothetical protein Agub_g13882, partial [Astrephomene gubernaculifera]
MPRPRSQRTPAANEVLEQPSETAPTVPSEQPQPPARRVLDNSQDQILRSLPSSLSREQKLAALGWRGGCFCCPANISFGQCIAGFWQAARSPAKSTDSLVHWGLNASKFLFEAGPNAAPGFELLLRAGFLSLAPQLLTLTGEVPQTIMLTPQLSFTQVFATGGKQIPLATSPQLVTLSLLAQLSAAPAALAALAASPDIIPSLLRALSASSDDRFRSLAFQTLAECLNFYPEEEAQEEGAAAAVSTAAALAARLRSSLIQRLLDSGVAGVTAAALERSTSATVARDACAFLLGMLLGSSGSSGNSSSSSTAARTAGSNAARQQQQQHGGRAGGD